MNIPVRPTRKFVPKDLKIDNWEDLEPLFSELKTRTIDNADQFEKWLLDISELESVLEEDVAWRYIRMTVDTANEEYSSAYENFIANIQPKMAPESNALNKKLANHSSLIGNPSSAHKIYFRKISSEIDLFREENITLISDIQQNAKKYGAITGNLKIEHDGEQMTMPKAGSLLRSNDRALRETIYTKIHDARAEVAEQINELFSTLIKQRTEVAKNAGKSNFVEYSFESMGRFDYSAEDCYAFHEGIEKEIVPLVKTFQEERKNLLNYESLRPWDLQVDPKNSPPLNPFDGSKELIGKSIETFSKIDPYFGDCLSVMDQMGYLDLESKEGKAPGGYNYPLYEIGVPFIFMNAVGTQRDLVTMMHEGGHAVHSFLSRDLELSSFKSCPSEVAELASMAMELITMHEWRTFYPDSETHKRAVLEHLKDLLAGLPWIAIIDAFQHWIYQNPDHSTEDRQQAWLDLLERFSTGVVDWDGLESAKKIQWQKQLHLFEVPFYYIEYGMAQLGAIAIYKNYKSDPEKTIKQYKEALTLGYTKSIGEIYATAGIEFNFSAEYVRDLAEFIRSEIQSLTS